MTTSTPECQIRLATSEEDRLAALRVRYDVFCEEKQDWRYSVEGHRICQDALDRDSANYVLAVSSDKVVGSSRVSFRRDGVFVKEDLYRWDLMRTEFQESVDAIQQVTALWDRGAILRPYRRSGFFKEMERFVVSYAASQGCRFGLSTVRTDNSETMAFLANRGWRILCSMQIDEVTWTQQFKHLT